MKLYLVSVIDDTEEYYRLVVANSEQEAEDIVGNDGYWSCLMYISAQEIDSVDGYRVKLEKIKEPKDKILEICDEILKEEWDSSCTLGCSGIKCEECFFGDTIEECMNRKTEMFKYLAKCYKEKNS